MVWSEFRGGLYMYSLGIYMYIYTYLDLEFSFFLPFFLLGIMDIDTLNIFYLFEHLDHSSLHPFDYYRATMTPRSMYDTKLKKVKEATFL